ncbi:hypothetical protein HispidOSU_009371, partial [Sigmodon hispidus]
IEWTGLRRDQVFYGASDFHSESSEASQKEHHSAVSSSLPPELENVMGKQVCLQTGNEGS